MNNLNEFKNNAYLCSNIMNKLPATSCVQQISYSKLNSNKFSL